MRARVGAREPPLLGNLHRRHYRACVERWLPTTHIHFNRALRDHHVRVVHTGIASHKRLLFRREAERNGGCLPGLDAAANPCKVRTN